MVLSRQVDASERLNLLTVGHPPPDRWRVRCFAGQSEKCREERPGFAFEFPRDLESMYVDVKLVDEVLGPVITYTYELRTKPLAVFEIIRGG